MNAQGSQQQDRSEQLAEAQVASGKHIVFFDGVCGLCSKLVQFIIANDHEDLFLFAPLQSEFAASTLTPRGIDPAKLDTIWVIAEYGQPSERLLSKSDGVVFTIGKLKRWFQPLATIFGLQPKWLRDFQYLLIAAIRYRIAGKRDQCMLPSADNRRKFIDH